MTIVYNHSQRDLVYLMTTPLNGNNFLVTGPLYGGFTGHRWIPLTKASDAELWCFLWATPEETAKWTIEKPVIWVTIALIMTSLQCYQINFVCELRTDLPMHYWLGSNNTFMAGSLLFLSGIWQINPLSADCFREKQIVICICYHFLTLRCHRYLKYVSREDDAFKLYSQYHVTRWPGKAKSDVKVITLFSSFIRNIPFQAPEG